MIDNLLLIATQVNNTTTDLIPIIFISLFYFALSFGSFMYLLSRYEKLIVNSSSSNSAGQRVYEGSKSDKGISIPRVRVLSKSIREKKDIFHSFPSFKKTFLALSSLAILSITGSTIYHLSTNRNNSIPLSTLNKQQLEETTIEDMISKGQLLSIREIISTKYKPNYLRQIVNSSRSLHYSMYKVKKYENKNINFKK